MLEKLNDLVLRREDLEAQLSDPAVYGDADRVRSINRELKELSPVVETYQSYQRALQSQAEAEALLHDPEFRDLAQEELSAAKEAAERLERAVYRRQEGAVRAVWSAGKKIYTADEKGQRSKP